MINDEEAVLVGGQGGQGDKQQMCRDAVWHLNLGKLMMVLGRSSRKHLVLIIDLSEILNQSHGSDW